MPKRPLPSVPSDAVLKRAEQLDALDAILPFDRRDQLAAILTDDDVETLKHLAAEGMGQNTMRAFASDLGYLEGWSLAATGALLPWPAPEAMLLKFVAHNLWRPEQRDLDPEHGMSGDIEQSLRDQGFLRSTGPHAPSTVRRRLASWSTLTKWKGVDGAFASPALKAAIRLAVRAGTRPRRRKSAKAITGDVMARMLATCASESLRDLRDRAILMLAFASGGRRRSEVAGLRYEQLSAEDPVILEDGSALPSLGIHLGRTKTGSADQADVVYLTGQPVEAMQAWLAAAKIEGGSLFRKIDRWGNVSRRPLDPSAVNDIVKQRATLAGLEPADFSAHGLRSGYLTEAANRGVPLPEAMEQSRHRSVQVASGYYNSATRRSGKAAQLLR